MKYFGLDSEKEFDDWFAAQETYLAPLGLEKAVKEAMYLFAKVAWLQSATVTIQAVTEALAKL